MTRSRIIRSIGLSLVFAAVAVPAARAAVFIVRHAEKQTESNDKDVPLSEAGQARARRIAQILRDSGIVAVYSTDTVRTRATAEPLATALHLQPILYDASASTSASMGASTSTSTSTSTAMEALAARIRKDHARDNVLVVGHSNTIAPLVKALGSSDAVSIGAGDYDGLWIVVPAASGPPTLIRLRQ
jgi:probable phosphoglycerate mutase